MAAHTWLGVGGPADAYVEPADAADLGGLVSFLSQRDVAYLVIGGGSNLLVGDAGFRGVVIDMATGFQGIAFLEKGSHISRVRARAGERLARLCRFAIDNALSGINFATGIPGSVGGAVSMNAGAAGGAMADVLEALRIVSPDGGMRVVSSSELTFGYRRTIFPQDDHPGRPLVVVSADFRFRAGRREVLSEEAERLKRERRKKQPAGAKSAGCFFRNPEKGDPAGRLIDAAGLKGVTVGGARVSEKHANFFLNQGQATAADFFCLMEKVRETVYQKFQVRLEPEVRIVGEQGGK
jgi:UDP-N-acetylmuramate dehydrogenase